MFEKIIEEALQQDDFEKVKKCIAKGNLTDSVKMKIAYDAGAKKGNWDLAEYVVNTISEKRDNEEYNTHIYREGLIMQGY